MCIAEKPSVAKEIANILGATTRRNGYLEGNGYCVTWTFGHLCTLQEPGEYTEKWQKWNLGVLPMIPSKFRIRLIEDEGIKKQFAVIEELVSKAEMVINCGDAGQEGELIQRWVLTKAKCGVPIKRLWISSLTEEAIREGFEKLMESQDFDTLYAAGSARAIGDWLLGMNATRAYTLKYGTGKNVLSIGRVQTPTLALVVERQKAIENFKPETYWEIRTNYREGLFSCLRGRFNKKEEAEALLEKITPLELEILSIERKKAMEHPPKLFDLTLLQVECNRKFAYTAENTLKIIQSLYEKKLTTPGYEGFADVKINGDKKVSLTLDADINHLELDTESTVSTTANASVYRMTASKPASVTGYGTIYQAEIKSSGVSFASSVRVSGYTIANGVTATAGGQTLTGSVTAAVSPESIAVDLNNLSALGKNVAVTVPNGLKIEKIESNGAVLAAGTDYTQTSTGAAISADWLGRLPRGSYKLTLMLSDGKTTAIAIEVTDSSVSENVQNASFDRYYKSEKYADVHTRLSGANTSEDIRNVVLGLSSIDYTFDSSTRSLILPRGVLAQLRAGSYTISVELKNGKTEVFTLTVSDSAPTGESWAVEEYNTFSPSEPKFTLPLTRTSLKSVTVNGDTLTSNKDYTVSSQTLTLKKSALERYRKDGTAVVFSADLADGTTYALVIDYVKRK
mgnify:CR=1 FL=1